MNVALPRRAWIEILLRPLQFPLLLGRSPQESVDWNLEERHHDYIFHQVALPRRAWIEILSDRKKVASLKVALPRRAWIEILESYCFYCSSSVALPRRAWIEIVIALIIKSSWRSLSPGERGLKSKIIIKLFTITVVALPRRAWIEIILMLLSYLKIAGRSPQESVDWNIINITIMLIIFLSLSPGERGLK